VRETGTEFRYSGLDGTELPFVFMPKGYINGINLGYAESGEILQPSPSLWIGR
jgi:hypothetical protein